MKKIIITIASLGIFGAFLTVPVVPENLTWTSSEGGLPRFDTQSSFLNQNQYAINQFGETLIFTSDYPYFRVMSEKDSLNLSTLKKVEIIGERYVNYFTDGSKEYIQEISEEEYRKLGSKNAIAPKKKTGISIFEKVSKKAEAAITLDTSDNPVTFTGTSQTTSYTVSGTNPLLVVSIGVASNSSSISGITYNSVNLASAAFANVSDAPSYVWYLEAPDTGTYNLVISKTSSQNARAIISSWNGVLQSGAKDVAGTDTTVTDIGPCKQVSITLNTTVANTLIVDAVSNDYIEAMSEGANQTELYDVANGTSDKVAASYWITSDAAGSHTVTYCDEDDFNDGTGYAAASFKPVASAVYQSGLKVMIIN